MYLNVIKELKLTPIITHNCIIIVHRPLVSRTMLNVPYVPQKMYQPLLSCKMPKIPFKRSKSAIITHHPFLSPMVLMVLYYHKRTY